MSKVFHTLLSYAFKISVLAFNTLLNPSIQHLNALTVTHCEVLSTKVAHGNVEAIGYTSG